MPVNGYFAREINKRPCNKNENGYVSADACYCGKVVVIYVFSFRIHTHMPFDLFWSAKFVNVHIEFERISLAEITQY